MKKRALAMVLVAAGHVFAAQEPPKSVTPLDAGLNQAPRLTVGNINNETEILRNPGLAVDNAKTVLSRAAPETPKPIGPNLENSPRQIGDPTQMTGSFSQALTRIHGKPNAAGGGAAAQPDVPPQITLAARVSRRDSKGVLLSAGGKTHMVREKGGFTFFENKMLYEVQVDSIENDRVIITVMPLGRKMTLE
jgi:hypothetical protein